MDKTDPSAAEKHEQPKAARLQSIELDARGSEAIASAMNEVLADVFALYVKTKNFHWHMSGPSFRDYHLLLDEQSDQIFAMSDPVAERVRKIGQPTLRSIGQIARLQRIQDSEVADLVPKEMLAQLRDDNRDLAGRLRAAHDICEANRDVATASLIETWIDESERRVWFLSEIAVDSVQTRH